MYDDDDDDIDYMHPEGKLEETKGQEITEGESAKPDWKSEKYALQEADGHSMKKRDPFLDPEAEQST